MGGMVEEVGRYLDVNSTRLTRGTNLFANVPPDVDVAHVTIIETGGQPPAWTHGTGTLPAWERPRFQLLARSTKPAGGAIPHSTTARELIHHAWVLLGGVVNTTIASSTSASATTYLRLEPVQSPFLVGQEEDGRLAFACNVEAWRVPSTSYE